MLTSEGPIVVHNCSYGLGFSNFAQQLLVGFLGAPPVRYTLADARALGVTAAMAEKFTDYAENMKRVAAIPHVCTDKELLVHCIAAKAIIDKYRGVANPVVDFWELLVSRIEPSLIGGEEYNHKDVLLFRKNEIVMASGLSLKYHNIRKIHVPKEGMQYQYDVGNTVEKLYGGRMANHVTQGTARIVMTDAMLRVEKRYPVVGTVHDELLALIPEEEAEEGLAWVLEQMTMEPKWLPGIPLNADGGFAKRYGEAKK